MSHTIANRNQGSHFEKKSGFDAMIISQKDAEIEFLRQQLEILKQELNCECQITQLYRQQLQDKERELRSVEDKLSTVLVFQRLELNEAKELAKSILKSKMSVTDSLAKLIGGIYNLTVKKGEVESDRELDLYQKTLSEVC